MSWRIISRLRSLRWQGALVVVLLLGSYVTYYSPLPFIPSWWKAGETNWDDTYYRRHRMADAFLLTGRLIGMPRAKVIALLGKPDTEYFREFNIVYNLGAERGFMGIDSEWLVMRTDASGVVTEAKIVRD